MAVHGWQLLHHHDCCTTAAAHVQLTTAPSFPQAPPTWSPCCASTRPRRAAVSAAHWRGVRQHLAQLTPLRCVHGRMAAHAHLLAALAYHHSPGSATTVFCLYSPLRSLHLVLLHHRVQRNPSAPPRPAGGAQTGLGEGGSKRSSAPRLGSTGHPLGTVHQLGTVHPCTHPLPQVLAGPWYFDRKGEVPPGKQPFFEIPVFK